MFILTLLSSAVFRLQKLFSDLFLFVLLGDKRLLLEFFK